jgi:hypothetical protein
VRWKLAFAVALAFLGGAAWRHWSGAEPPAMPLHAAAAPVREAAANAGPVQPMPAPAGAPAQLANVLERAPDLRSVFERYKDSADVTERNAAYRAWSACYPTFIAPAGQPVTLDMVTHALPRGAPDHAERIEAYRSLLGRCKAFFNLDRDSVVAQTEAQQAAWQSGRARAPGELALQHLEQGDAAGAVREARAAIASGDAYAIYSLRDFMARHLKRQGDADGNAPPAQPELRALAFYLAPCELGMECGPDSLTALQLCANRGECSGTVAERYAHSFAGQVDRDTLLRESSRVAAAIRAGDLMALGL